MQGAPPGSTSRGTSPQSRLGPSPTPGLPTPGRWPKRAVVCSRSGGTVNGARRSRGAFAILLSPLGRALAGTRSTRSTGAARRLRAESTQTGRRAPDHGPPGPGNRTRGPIRCEFRLPPAPVKPRAGRSNGSWPPCGILSRCQSEIYPIHCQSMSYPITYTLFVASRRKLRRESSRNSTAIMQMDVSICIQKSFLAWSKFGNFCGLH